MLADTASTWPFWAPSQAEAIEAALDLAGVGDGTRVIDLGCGDGQVLLAAASRGAIVAGIEADADLVDEARDNLRSAGVDADIRVGDLFDPDLALDADVFFTYLAPATLQRLLPRLATHRGAALVTVDFAVPGLVPSRRTDPARLYRLPGRRRPVGPAGWESAGTLVSTVPDCQSLSCLELVHPGGAVHARLRGEVADVATAFAGATDLPGPAHLAVDLRWEPMAPGTAADGVLAVAGSPDHALFVVVTETEEEAMWDLTGDGVRSLRAALRRRPRPTTLEALLEATRS